MSNKLVFIEKDIPEYLNNYENIIKKLYKNNNNSLQKIIQNIFPKCNNMKLIEDYSEIDIEKLLTFLTITQDDWNFYEEIRYVLSNLYDNDILKKDELKYISLLNTITCKQFEDFNDDLTFFIETNYLYDKDIIKDIINLYNYYKVIIKK